MATEKSFQLYINKDNVKHYFTASGGVLNGAQISTKYITMRTSSTHATFTMNDAGRDVLFPSTAAIAHKVDVWAQSIATLNSSKNTINVAIAGQNAITTERIHTSLTEHTGSVSGSFTKSNTSAIYTIKILNGFHAAGVRDTSITAYFTQYSCTANKSGNGVKNVSVSNTAPYEGETVTFSAELYNGANFEGWYSNESCTQLVSSNLTYSTTATDLTLYAKATIDANLYNVSAVAGSEITSVSVSDSIVPDGGTATFTAQVNEGCSFEAWYSNDAYTTVVSTENPYTATITANTTLYAKAHRNSLNMSVGSAEHGTASVSATTVPYGNDVTFTFTPEDETWELYGWYSDSELMQLVSEANPYAFTATEDTTLYPKIGKKRYTIKYGRARDLIAGGKFKINIIVVDFNSLTRDEINCLRTGDYDSIDPSKIVARDSISDSNALTDSWKTIQCTYDMYVAVYLPEVLGIDDEYDYSIVKDGNGNSLTYWPYYWFQPTADATISSVSRAAKFWCNCSAVAKDGIAYAYATTPTAQEYGAIFEAEVSSGYTFSGWYSNEACTKLVSTDNPANVVTPKYTTNHASQTSLTLYAKATKAIYTIGVGTAEHGSATVSKSTAQYGDEVTFSCVVDEGYEFIGWYSDEGLTQLVSESAEYVHSVTGNVILYPKVGRIRYKITFKTTEIAFAIDMKVAVLDFDALTRTEKSYLKVGNYEAIEPSKVFDIKSASINSPVGKILTVEILCPLGMTAAFWGTDPRININEVCYIRDANNKSLTSWPYYWYQPSEDATFKLAEGGIPCDCSAIAKEGVSYADATTPTRQGKDAIFEAEVASGYTFSGWYSDEACTTLVSTANPAHVTAPRYTTEDASRTSLILYAKATHLSSTTSLLFKRNGSWIKAKSVFKKTNGAWVEQEDLSAIFSGESSGTASNYVYGGNV